MSIDVLATFPIVLRSEYVLQVGKDIATLHYNSILKGQGNEVLAHRMQVIPARITGLLFDL